jgi:hypothetical protein
MTRKPVAVAAVNFSALGVIALALVPAALAGKGGNGGGKPGGSCTQRAPLVQVENTWAWGQTGSFGVPGRDLTYPIQVMNYDVADSSSFVVNEVDPGDGEADGGSEVHQSSLP